MKTDCTIVESARLLDNAIRNENYNSDNSQNSVFIFESWVHLRKISLHLK